MSNTEARALGAQLGYDVNTVAGLEVLLESRALKIGLDMKTGDWVVASKTGEILARCE